MNEEGQPPEAGPEEPGKPVEGEAQPAVYDGPNPKLKGKTAEQMAEIYENLESAYGKTTTELKAEQEKTEGTEKWYQNLTPEQKRALQPQQQQQVQPPVQQAPADIYDNPGQFVDQRTQPLIDRAVEQANLRNAVSGAKRVLFSAKQMYPGAFEGVEDDKVLGIMMNGVKSGTTHYSILENEDAMKMAAWQMKGEESGYKPPGPTPVSPTQSEQPSGGSNDGEPPPMSPEAKGWAEAFGKDTKKAQKIWETTLKERGGE